MAQRSPDRRAPREKARVTTFSASQSRGAPRGRLARSPLEPAALDEMLTKAGVDQDGDGELTLDEVRRTSS